MRKTKKKGQLDEQSKKLKKKLSEIHQQLYRGDIKDCAIALELKGDTVFKYLSGAILYPDTAMKIINYFDELIEERKNKIDQL